MMLAYTKMPNFFALLGKGMIFLYHKNLQLLDIETDKDIRKIAVSYTFSYLSDIPSNIAAEWHVSPLT